MKIVLTGGAGYIGAHTVLACLREGHEVVVLDNLVNGSREALRRVEALAERDVVFHAVDLLDSEALEAVLARHADADAVMHFAGLKAVGESVADPLRYYRHNVGGTLNLCATMQRHGLHRLIFSSSATVYSPDNPMPVSEEAALSPINPYGRTKRVIEQLLQDLVAADPRWGVVVLRYFNPVGADASGRIGEDPHGAPDNLMPFITQVAVGQRPELRVFGDDYPTPDGTGVRDYIHVSDLAAGHTAALPILAEGGTWEAVNLGTGQGYSVLEVVTAFERVTGVAVPYTVSERRPGDVAVCYADPARAERRLGWQATRDLDTMVADAWRWQSANPSGYSD